MSDFKFHDFGERGVKSDDLTLLGDTVFAGSHPVFNTRDTYQFAQKVSMPRLAGGKVGPLEMTEAQVAAKMELVFREGVIIRPRSLLLPPVEKPTIVKYKREPETTGVRVPGSK